MLLFFYMRRNFLILTAIIFLLEFYVYQSIKTVISSQYGRWIYIGVNAILYILLVYNLLAFSRDRADHRQFQTIAVIFLAFLIPKIIIVAFLMIDDLVRFLHFGYNYVSDSGSSLPARRKFLSLIGLGIAGTLTALFVDGVVFGKYRHRVRQVRLKIKNLPESFKGYKIVHISDMHAGSFFNPEKLKPAFDLINAQDPDLVVFTGDMVNDRAEEFINVQEMFASIKSKDGKFSILGNHDYGMYIEWNSPEAKAANVPNLIKLKKEAGFETLLNEHHIIEKNGERIYLVGVENWGVKPFPQYGDLNKATAGIPNDAVKILLSHDPSHFEAEVKNHPSDIALTLSGHTHGMQFGIDLKNLKWSPVQYRYKHWADLYEVDGKYLYINRGFGVIGYPGRVGVLPEITLIELS